VAEAKAIATAFCLAAGGAESAPTPLKVGSIKTVIGHTEGAAGLAGIMKASLALQNTTIPPNLLFESLNPRIRPFYTNVEVSTAASSWLAPLGGPRRASVNR
jgi:hybrid polyketide synthase / nonribosomal peptide synthetase ACE1